MADIPITREEKYLAYLTGDYKADIPKPITRQERYLYELCLKSMGGEISPEEIQKAVNDYLDKNPVKPGATTEQAQQIEQNKADVASLKTETNSLKEDISTKITKFYSSNQGETNLQDSDDGKIMDMMVYGKSEQKQYSGKNLLNATLQTTTLNGVTCTNNGDGTYTLNGTASDLTSFAVLKQTINIYSEKKLIGCPNGGGSGTYVLLIAYYDENQKWLSEQYDTGGGTIIKDSSHIDFQIIIKKGTVCNNLLFKPMIVDASLYPDTTYDDFEPYTGGIPSPNPSYPQEILSVKNPTVKVCGKNLLNANNISTGIINSNGNVEENNTYFYTDFIRVKNEITVSFYIDKDCIRIAKYDSEGKFITRLLLAPGSIKNVTINDCSFIKISALKDDINNIQIELGSTPTAYEQTVTLPYTLNAIPVSSGGNVTIDDQQYIADYVDVERGKLVQRIWKEEFDGSNDENWIIDTEYKRYYILISAIGDNYDYKKTHSYCNRYKYNTNVYLDINHENGFVRSSSAFYFRDDNITDLSPGNLRAYLAEHPLIIMTYLNDPVEIDLTSEEIAALKALATYYPVTNISVNSEQLDGYTVFNYPISMANGWNYVKQQIGDTRDYIYDMDARTQDTDLQAAEAYVNSEYAVALTELEV